MAGKRANKQQGGTDEPGSLSRTPIYHQIFMLLKGKIHDGEYAVGQYLPGERELCEMFGISRITAVRVLNELAANGLVVREQGRGTRVSFVARGMLMRGPAEYAGEEKPVGHTLSVHDYLSTLRRRAPDSGAVTLYEFGEAEAPEAVAKALAIPAGERVQKAARVWRFAGLPYNHLVTMVPSSIACIWTGEDLLAKPLSVLIEEAGIRIDRIDEHVSATMADMELSQRLEVPFGSPLLRVIRILHDRHGKPIEYMVGHYPPDRYQYRVSLSRRGVSKTSEFPPRSGSIDPDSVDI